MASDTYILFLKALLKLCCAAITLFVPIAIGTMNVAAGCFAFIPAVGMFMWVNLERDEGEERWKARYFREVDKVSAAVQHEIDQNNEIEALRCIIDDFVESLGFPRDEIIRRLDKERKPGTKRPTVNSVLIELSSEAAFKLHRQAQGYDDETIQKQIDSVK